MEDGPSNKQLSDDETLQYLVRCGWRVCGIWTKFFSHSNFREGSVLCFQDLAYQVQTKWDENKQELQ